jgi:hypothetical protein
MTGCTGTEGPMTNSKGESHCFHCGGVTHWAYECPQLSGEQQAQLHMNLETEQDKEEVNWTKEGHQLLHVSLAQGGELPDNWAYLDRCSMVTAFKSNWYLKGVKTVKDGIRINCNATMMVTNKKGNYRRLKVWYVPNRIANIFLMHELEKLYCITYDSWEGYYIVHTPRGEVRFYKDEQGLPFFDLEELNEEAAMMLLQRGVESYKGGEDATMLVQTVQGNYEGYIKQEVLKAKAAQQGQALIGSPSKKDYQGMVSSNLILNCPFLTTNVTNARAIFGPDLASVRGKKVWCTPAPVVADYVAAPCSLVEANKVIMLVAGVFFVDGTAFLLTVL